MSLLQIYEPGQTPLPHEDEPAIGIDLGTTHSVVAVVNTTDGQHVPEIIRNISGQGLLPSVVYYAPDGTIIVGNDARIAFEQGKPGAVASIKRLMGKGGQDIKPLLGTLPYDIVKDGSNHLQLRVNDRRVTPVEVSAEILKTLKATAEQALGRQVNKAVITVPAYFDDAARGATKDAARLAGLEVLRLVNEPTAAALAYGLDKGVEGIYAVYDLGGGTFDISLLKLEQGVFQVLSTAGDTELGGDDFDQAIAAWLLSECGLNGHAPSREDVGVLVAKARLAKHALSEASSVEIIHNNTSITLTRDAYDALIQPYVAKTLAVCEQALLDANLTIADIKGVVMVGGSTRVPFVRAEVARLFNKPPLTDVNPDEVVAHGAALQAHMLSMPQDNSLDSLLIDVIPLSLGLETMGGLVEKILYRNTPIPVSVTQEFTTYQDSQTGMQVHVLQGEREMANHNRSLAQFELVGIPPLPAGIARIAITFSVDADGLLTVSAEEKITGTRQTVHVKPSYGLPPEQIEQMLMESMQHARKDITERLIVESRVEAGRAIAELQSALGQDGDLLEKVEHQRLERQIQVVKNAMEGEDRDYIDAELQELGRIAQAFAERRMDRAISRVLKGTHVDKVMEEK